MSLSDMLDKKKQLSGFQNRINDNDYILIIKLYLLIIITYYLLMK